MERQTRFTAGIAWVWRGLCIVGIAILMIAGFQTSNPALKMVFIGGISILGALIAIPLVINGLFRK